MRYLSKLCVFRTSRLHDLLIRRWSPQRLPLVVVTRKVLQPHQHLPYAQNTTSYSALTESPCLSRAYLSVLLCTFCLLSLARSNSRSLALTLAEFLLHECFCLVFFLDEQFFFIQNSYSNSRSLISRERSLPRQG